MEWEHDYVEGNFERFGDSGYWEMTESREPLEVLIIGDQSGYRYATLVGSDVPVRWAIGEGSHGTIVRSVEVVGALI